MPRVHVELPALLRRFVGNRARVDVTATTLAGALERLVEEAPALRVHLFDERGALRRHVLCFHNETDTRHVEPGDAALAEGDTIRILQAVSGG